MRKSPVSDIDGDPCHPIDRHSQALCNCPADIHAGATTLRHRTESFQLAAKPLRSSSARRIERLQALVSELLVRDMGYGAVAIFLRCSSSAARNYVRELMDAGLLMMPAVRQPAGCIDKFAYRLNPDGLRIENYLTTLAASQRGDEISTRGGDHVQMRASVSHFHILRDDVQISLTVSSTPAQRDPLVAALFGAPSR